MASDRVIFNLKRCFYEEILAGRKDYELRDNKEHWQKRLLGEKQPSKAWFVPGFPKGNLPRIEADITKISDKEIPGKIIVHFTIVKKEP